MSEEYINKINTINSGYIIQKINTLRQNPKSFIDTILQAKNNVIMDKSGINIYKSSVKVALNLGERAFDLAADILKKTEPMGKLIYNPDLTIEFQIMKMILNLEIIFPIKFKVKLIQEKILNLSGKILLKILKLALYLLLLMIQDKILEIKEMIS